MVDKVLDHRQGVLGLVHRHHVAGLVDLQKREVEDGAHGTGLCNQSTNQSINQHITIGAKAERSSNQSASERVPCTTVEAYHSERSNANQTKAAHCKRTTVTAATANQQQQQQQQKCSYRTFSPSTIQS